MTNKLLMKVSFTNHNWFWFWFIFDLVNELITNIDLKIETNVTTYDYGEFDMLIKILYKTTNKQYDDTQTTEQTNRLKLNLTCEL